MPFFGIQLSIDIALGWVKVSFIIVTWYHWDVIATKWEIHFDVANCIHLIIICCLRLPNGLPTYMKMHSSIWKWLKPLLLPTYIYWWVAWSHLVSCKCVRSQGYDTDSLPGLWFIFIFHFSKEKLWSWEWGYIISNFNLILDGDG